MTKNVTVSLPDELFARMAKLTEVNWSAVARESIEAYVERRDQPDIAPTIERIAKEKSQEYTAGVKRATEIVTEKSYKEIDEIFARLDSRVEDALDIEEKRRGDGISPFYAASMAAGFSYKPAVSITNEKRFRILEEVLKDMGFLSGRSSTEFLHGLYDGLYDWKNKIEKVK